MELNEIPYRDFLKRAEEFLRELKTSKLLAANIFIYIEVYMMPEHL